MVTMGPNLRCPAASLGIWRTAPRREAATPHSSPVTRTHSTTGAAAHRELQQAPC